MKKTTLIAVLLVVVLVLAGCGLTLGSKALPANGPSTTTSAPVTNTSFKTADTTPVPTAPVVASADVNTTIAALQGTFQQIYENVNPSVVQIQVVSQASSSGGLNPFGQGGGQQAGLGSGFVWDTQGHIVTNNHVTDGATSITVLFSDGSTTSAKLVGADPQSDLAVIQVNVAASKLVPVKLGDSSQVKVGQLAIAIGNPFGEQNTMTSGIVSAIGRYLPADQNATGPSYTIPDVIQTDAPINPGNSGGVLLDISGNVIGVTQSIESNSGSSAGIGFAIPSEVVRAVIPSLISTGKFDHPYLGISGATLTPDLAKAMNLNETQQGALVAEVTAGGPAAAAGLQGSTQNVTINGQQTQVGGDVITAINNQPVKTFNDLVLYLAVSAQVGQKVDLTILRSGKQQNVTVTLGSRPATTAQSNTNPFQGFPFQTNPNGNQGNSTGSAYLGIIGLSVTSDIAQAMSLPSNQTGVLVQQVQSGSPAASAGLVGGSKSVTINGQSLQVGGDVVIALGRQQITTMQDLTSLLSQLQPGDRTTLTVLRNGRQVRVSVTLGEAPSTTQ